MVNIVKFAHILTALALLGLTSYCLFVASGRHRVSLLFFNKSLLIISFFALLTGSLLVYPKHFNFHTPWIQAAYVLLIMYGLALRFSIKFFHHMTKTWLWRSFYVILIFILILIIHDAVTKQPFINLVNDTH